MKHSFLSSPVNTKATLSPETPFKKAKQEWDERIGSSVVQARNWRTCCFITLVLSIILTGVIAYLVTQNRVIPIMVGLDKESGEAKAIGKVEDGVFSPGPLQIKYFLSQFIRFVRAVPLDQVVIKQNWLRAYTYLRSDASGLLNEITVKDADSPLKKIGKLIVSVQPISVIQIPDTNSYQMRWKETQYSAQGQKMDEYSMVGTFSIEIDPPKDEETIQENPLGLFIKSFQWNREL